MTIEQIKAEVKKNTGEGITDEQAAEILAAQSSMEITYEQDAACHAAHRHGKLTDEELDGVVGGYDTSKYVTDETYEEIRVKATSQGRPFQMDHSNAGLKHPNHSERWIWYKSKDNFTFYDVKCYWCGAVYFKMGKYY